MNPMALYAVIAQQPPTEHSKRDGVVVRRRSRRPGRRNAARSFL